MSCRKMQIMKYLKMLNTQKNGIQFFLEKWIKKSEKRKKFKKPKKTSLSKLKQKPKNNIRQNYEFGSCTFSVIVVVRKRWKYIV